MDERTDDLSSPSDLEDPVIVRPNRDEIAAGVEPAGMDTGYPLSQVAPSADGAPDLGADDAEDADDETRAMRDGIERTRSDMSETIDAIQERLSPQRLKEQAQEAIHDATIGKVENVVNDIQGSAHGMGETILETIRQNPVPAALVGLGLGWLFVKGRQTGQTGRVSSYQYRPLGRPTPYSYGSYRVPVEGYQTGSQGGVRQAANTAQQKAGQLVDSAQATVGGMADQVQSKAGDLADQVQSRAGDFADTARDTVQQAGQQVQSQAQQMRGVFERTLQDNPLAVGAVALALGAAVGLAIPETQQEHQLLGSARDTLMDRTQDAAQDTVQKVQSVVTRAKDAAQQAAQQEAQHQGLTQGGAATSQQGKSMPREGEPLGQSGDPGGSI